jgi:hypothetical protein
MPDKRATLFFVLFGLSAVAAAVFLVAVILPRHVAVPPDIAAAEAFWVVATLYPIARSVFGFGDDRPWRMFAEISPYVNGAFIAAITIAEVNAMLARGDADGADLAFKMGLGGGVAMGIFILVRIALRRSGAPPPASPARA